ncbi:MAG: hypothetical protein A2066_10435 [Bacteroidetes bacterium GWB2_41_8]|nr:MAG: hypothetical protein A2066_10435 [Bacteroidetes bacterium GWB2_41_8]
MIDFLKIAIFDSVQIERIWNNPLLEYCSEKKRRITEDEIRTSKTKIYRNLVFEKYANSLYIKGSIHAFFNDGIHNANDFSFVYSINTILHLAKTLDLDLTKCFIQNIEFGLNILPIETVKNIINWLKYHERNEFFKDPELQYSKRSQSYTKNYKANNYKVIKAYAKDIQPFNGKTYEHHNTMRIEIKSKETKYFKHFGIYKLTDLIKPEIYLALSDELIKEWDNVLILEKGLQGEEKKLDKYLNSDFWENCLNEYRNKFASEKKKYSEIVNHYPENIHSDIKNKLKSKLDLFAKELKSSAISKGIQDVKVVQFPKSIRMESAPICLITGVDISMQKKDSRFLSTTGLRWLKDNDPCQYQIISKCFLPNHGVILNHTKYEQNEISHIAKQIRNEYHNRRRYFDRVPPNQLSIFGS